MESLQARIAALEAQLTSMGCPATEQRIASDAREGVLSDTDTTSTHEESGSADRDPVSEITGLVGSLNMSTDGQLHYFGSQSSYNLVRSRMTDDVSKSTRSPQQQGLAAVQQLGHHVSISQELEIHLLDLYWRWSNPWNYIIHKETFLEDYHEGRGVYCTPLLLSVVLAHASRYSDRTELRTVPSDPHTAGKAFLEQAKLLYLYESEAPTVATVQAGALMALRTMADGQEALGWLYCGNFPTGLDSDSSSQVWQGTRREWRLTLASISTALNG